MRFRNIGPTYRHQLQRKISYLSGSANNINCALSAICACCILPVDHKILQYLVSSQTTKFPPAGNPLEHTQQTLAYNNLVLSIIKNVFLWRYFHLITCLPRSIADHKLERTNNVQIFIPFRHQYIFITY